MNFRPPALVIIGLVACTNPAYATGRTARVAIEAGGGVLGTAAGMFTIGGLAYAITPASSNSCTGFCIGAEVGAAIFGGAIGGVLGLGTGVHVAGSASNGRGAYWAAMAGEGTGFAAAGALLGLAMLCDHYDHESCADVMKPLAVIGFLTLPIAGSIIGYEWSSGANRPATTTATTSQPLISWSGNF